MFGTSVCGAGDVNKDGYGDILIGAPQHLKNPSYIGKAYLVYGGQNISLSNSTVFDGDSVYGYFGEEVAGLGDINGDTYPDFGIMGLNKIQVVLGDTNALNYQHIDLFEKADWGHFTQISCGKHLNTDKYNDFIIGVEKINGDIYGGVLSTYGDSLFNFQFIDEIKGHFLPSNFGISISFLGKVHDRSNNCFIVGGIEGEENNRRGRVYVYDYSKPDDVNEKHGYTPLIFQLKQNFPNPFNPSTNISYQLPIDGMVKLIVFDVLGQEVATIVNEFESAGYYNAILDASNLPSGIYFARISVISKEREPFLQTIKMLLTK